MSHDPYFSPDLFMPSDPTSSWAIHLCMAFYRLDVIFWTTEVSYMGHHPMKAITEGAN